MCTALIPSSFEIVLIRLMIGITFIILIFTIFAYLVTWVWKRNNYWKKKGIKHIKSLPLVGNCLPMVLNKKNVTDIIEDIYNTYPNELVVGYYEFMTPRLIVRDNDLVQKVLIKDFGHFVDHGFEVDEEKNPLDNQLFIMTGNKWRAFRSKLTPLFTSGKLKTMYDIMFDVGKNLLQYMDKNIKTDIDVREAMGLFSMDIIGSAAFGINPGVLNNPESEFRVMGKKLNDTGIRNLIRIWFFFAFPAVAKKLGFSFQDRKVTNYFCEIIKNAIDYRKKNNIQRNDFIQMMLQLKEKGNIELKSLDPTDDFLKNDLNSEINSNTEVFEITDNNLMAQAHSFLTAGFEATALLLTYTMFEICQHQDIQETVRKEVMEQVKLNGGLTYDALRNMKYLEQTIKETQRFYPLVPTLFRICTKEYTLSNGYTIDKGEYVIIPVCAIHMDPNIYPDPKAFKPERFEDPPKPGTFLPFGEGPRMCIAMRYAMLVMKYGLALFLMNYKAKLSPATKLPVKFVNRAFGTIPSDKIMFQIEKVNIE